MQKRRRRQLVSVTVALVACLAGSCSWSDGPLEGRPFEVHEPPDYDGSKPAPLLVVLHGYGLQGNVQNLYYGLDRVTDPRGMLYVAPDGTINDEGKPFWNATPACCAPPGSDVDDSAYLAAVIESVQRDHNVDDRRIFVLGHSNGGFMAYRLACDHADLVAGVVSFEGAATDDPSACDPSEPVTAVEIHGTGDTVIRYDGGRNSGNDPNAPAYPSAEETVRMWARLNECSPTPTTPDPATRDLVRDEAPAVVTAFGSCAKGTAVQLWTQPEGVHVPIPSDTFTEQVVDFLLAHPKP